MHEWALAEAVVLTAEKAAKEQGFQEIQEIIIKLGELQQIERDTFEFAIREIIQPSRSLFKKTKIQIHDEKAVLQCLRCGHKWTFKRDTEKLSPAEFEAIHFVPEVAHVYMPCPECKSPDYKIIQGRGVWVDSIVGEVRD